MNWNSHVFCSIEDKVWKEVVIPYPHYLEDSNGDHRRLEDREHNLEEGPDRTASINRSRFLHCKRHALYKSNEHEHGQSSAETKVDDRNRPRCVELGAEPSKQAYRICSLGQSEHNHLERNDHGEDTEHVAYPTDQTVHSGYVPGGHRRA